MHVADRRPAAPGAGLGEPLSHMESVLDLGIEHQRRLALHRTLTARPGLPPPAISFWRRLTKWMPFQVRIVAWNAAFLELVDVPKLRPNMRAEEVFLKPEDAKFIARDTEEAHRDSMKLLCHTVEGFHEDAHSLAEGIYVHISRVGRIHRCLFDAVAILVCGTLQEILLVEWLIPESALPYVVTGGFMQPANALSCGGNTSWHFLQVDPDRSLGIKVSGGATPRSRSLPSARSPAEVWKCRSCSATDTPMRRYVRNIPCASDHINRFKSQIRARGAEDTLQPVRPTLVAP